MNKNIIIPYHILKLRSDLEKKFVILHQFKIVR